MDDIVSKLTADFLKTLAHPVRIQIIKLLAPGPQCVCEMLPELDVEQSNLSQHLGLLKRQGIIGSKKDGTKVIYTLLYPSVLAIIETVEKTLGEQITHSKSLLKHLK